MLRTITSHIDRVTANVDESIRVYSPFHLNFFVIPHQIVVEFDQEPTPKFIESILSVTLTGQRYRVLKSEIRAVGPGAGIATEHTTWGITRSHMQDDLIMLLHRIRMESFAESAARQRQR